MRLFLSASVRIVQSSYAQSVSVLRSDSINPNSGGIGDLPELMKKYHLREREAVLSL